MFGVLIMEEPQILYGTEGTVLGKWQGEIKLKSMKLLVSKNQGDEQLPFGGSRPRSLFETRPESLPFCGTNSRRQLSWAAGNGMLAMAAVDTTTCICRTRRGG